MTRRITGSALLLALLTAGCARQQFFQPDARVDAAPLPADAVSVRATAGRHYQRGPLHRLLFGTHYRRVWATPIAAPVLRLDTAVPGGLQPGKIGGGFQTTSMTLEGRQNREYSLRSLDKDPYKTLPKVARKSFLLNWVRDVTSAGMPYGAFVVPPLAGAAGVRHTSPRLFYVRSDENGLGPASERFRGRLVLLEEKLEGDQVPVADGNRKTRLDLVESEDMLAELYTNPAASVQADVYARARLLDLWLGDWDRHEGQWNWVAQPGGVYEPIPKDRDQVFFRFDDGILPWLGSRFVAKFRTFRPRYESIEGYTRNAAFIDSRTLPTVTRPMMLAEARRLQAALTDSVIAQAVRRLPPEVYAIEGPYLTSALRARRARLPEAAAEFYRLVAKEVTVAGTDKAERFVVERQSDSATVVRVYSLADDTKNRLQYQRVFRPAETRRILLHGLDGKDEFVLRGQVSRSPRIDIYGGPGEDSVTDSSRVAGPGKKTRFYDTRRNNSVEASRELNIKTTRGVASHAFDRDGSGR
ncbi:hypothetical protein GCM10027048_03080 [Hymenobacter coalescens]